MILNKTILAVISLLTLFTPFKHPQPPAGRVVYAFGRHKQLTFNNYEPFIEAQKNILHLRAVKAHRLAVMKQRRTAKRLAIKRRVVAEKRRASVIKQQEHIYHGAAVTAPSAPTVVSGVTNCGSNPLMAKIYELESGCRTWAYNPGGCRGIAQACPGSKLPCGDYDWACQDAWFRNYAVSVYGSIQAAYYFRIGHNYW